MSCDLCDAGSARRSVLKIPPNRTAGKSNLIPFLLVLFLCVSVQAQTPLRVSAPATVRGGESFNVDVTADNPSGIDAFGFEFHFNENLLTFNGPVQRGALTQGFSQLMGNRVAAGLVRVGAFNLTPLGNTPGTLCTIPMTVKTGVEDDTVLDITVTVDFPLAPIVVPKRISVQRETLPAGALAVGQKRGFRDSTLTLPVTASMPAGAAIRGLLARLQYNAAVLDYVDTSLGSQVPSGYTPAATPAGSGLLDLQLSTSNTDNLVDGEVFKVRFHVKTDAALGASIVTTQSPPSYFLNSSGGQIPVGTVRPGAIIVHPHGDSNKNGVVTVADLLLTLLGTLYTDYSDEFTACGGGGSTTVSDAVCVIGAIFSGGN